jgi:hypothetical protein
VVRRADSFEHRVEKCRAIIPLTESSLNRMLCLSAMVREFGPDAWE